MPASVYVPSPLENLPSEAGNLPEFKAPLPQSPGDDSTLRTVDDLIRRRAASYPLDHAVSYPSSETNYVDYNLQQLDVFAWRVAKHYETKLPVRRTSDEKPAVVGMLGPSNLEYLITKLALSKLGHTALLLSTRIPKVAIESLVNATGATAIVADGRYLDLAVEVQQTIPSLQCLQIAGRDTFEYAIEAHGDTRLTSALDGDVETQNIAFIIHSSGSTGLPKPIYQTQKSCLANYAISMDMKSFITLPLFHNHGICNLFRAVHSRKPIHLYNADLPLTKEHLMNIMREHRFDIFYGVPYALKLLSETDEGIRLLRDLKVVMYGGSACPDDLGNLLVDNGVNLVGHYGATEVGQLMTSFRPEGDKAWNYVRENEKIAPYLKWVPRGPNLYECCVTDGWPSKVQSNQPDNSYATKDLFEPHPTIPRAWKYIARIDDTIVLVNGEKFNPVAMEGSIRSNKNVTEAVVFGAGRPYLGILIVPSPMWNSKSQEDILEAVWPVVESANLSADSFARISKGMVRLLPSDCEYPRTDKGSVIRQAFYKQFKEQIDEAYDTEDIKGADLRKLDLVELQDFIRGLIGRTLTTKAPVNNGTDFFTLGLDSLQAIQMRTEILKIVDIGDGKLGQNAVFEHPSIEKLSQFLFDLGRGDSPTQAVSIEEEMKELVEKYETLALSSSKSSVVVTGATGSLGAHVVAKLTENSSISKVYCLVRAGSDLAASQRVKESMIQRRIYHTLPLVSRRKIVALPSKLADVQLGLSESTYANVVKDLGAVIHCAWSVNFNMRLSSFEKDNIAGVSHLISLCQSANPPASMNFCSSVSTCSQATTIPVPESLPPFQWAQGMGYAQSKSVSEHLCAKAAAQGLVSRVLRVGQIVGDTKHGVWNAQEAVPMMMQTAVTIGALPRLKETPSWLPVDVVAQTVVDISLSNAGSIFANVANPKMFDWTKDLLPALRAAGLSFDELEPKEWVQLLRTSNPDPKVNPPIKLVEFFASKYDKDEFSPSKPFATENACRFSPALANAPVLGQDLVDKFVGYFMSTSWKASTGGPSKTAVVVAGPCGSGKSTVGSAISDLLSVPFIEGDTLHSRSAIEMMKSNTALGDNERSGWLKRICRRASETLFELEYNSVVVTCSALTTNLRSTIREDLTSQGVKVVFVDLQADLDVLRQRLEGRTGHYMGAAMADGQVQLYERPGLEEVDVFPVDSEVQKADVLDEVTWFLKGLGQA
ncbi:hypothetical protein ACJ41O_007242 [Fusarium nematophilum]